MAKAKENINKSEIIRNAIAADPSIGNKALSAQLASENPGHAFPVASIATIRSKEKAKGNGAVSNGKVAKKAEPFDFPAPPARVTASPPEAELYQKYFMDWLRSLDSMIGIDGIKKLLA